MKNIIIFISFLSILACHETPQKLIDPHTIDIGKQKGLISSVLDSFNKAAAIADFDGYFSFFTDNAIFIGTDAKEYWTKETFMAWAKPFFDKKKTWNFKAIKRNIYFGRNADIAWFDELLHTQMKICRGSGVLVKQNNEWKIQQYVLSMTIPNEKVDEIVKIKGPLEDSVIQALEK